MSYQRSIRREPLDDRGDQPIQSIIISSPDKTLLIVVAFLVIIGFLAIFSATAPKCLDEGGNPAQFLIKQLICFVVGFFGLKFFMNYDYKKLSDWNVIIMSAILLSLFLVDFTPLGVVVNGANVGLILLDFNYNLLSLQNRLLFCCWQVLLEKMLICLTKINGYGHFFQ